MKDQREDSGVFVSAMGWRFSAKEYKRLPFSPKFEALGVVVGLLRTRVASQSRTSLIELHSYSDLVIALALWVRAVLWRRLSM